MTPDLTKIFLDTKEQVIKKVLFQLLGREATIEDAKRCTLVTREGLLDYEYLYYDNVQLGVITFVSPLFVHKWESRPKITCTFTPLSYDNNNLPDPPLEIQRIQ